MSYTMLSLFSGIGAFEKAFKNNNINLEIVNFSEIDKYAIQSYCLLHNVSKSLNLGDVSKINVSKIPTVNCITYGFPCQPFSVAGLKNGFNDLLGRGLMFFEALRIIEAIKPTLCIAENVKNLKNFNKEFSLMLNSLSNLGYYNTVIEVNSKDVGSPQNRERLFIISSLTPISPFTLSERTIELSDILLPYELVDKNELLKLEFFTNKLDLSHLNNAILEDFYANRPIRVYSEYSPALRATRYGLKVVQNGFPRKLSVLEGFRLMGWDDKDYITVKNSISKTQLWKQLGNSIDIKVLNKIVKELINQNIIKKEYIN